ncbi:MAG: hypothetical protein AAF289_18985, partial [Cyanobacteria bacterium P01_A01_bin.135]
MSDPVIVATSEGSADDDESSVAGDFAIQIAKSRATFVAANVVDVKANAVRAAAETDSAEADAEGV